MRRVWTGLAVVCWSVVAAAQPPAAGPARPPHDVPAGAGDILIQKTAGQPERRLKLLKLDTGPDGQRTADVQDVATGVRYTLPAAALAKMKRDLSPPELPQSRPTGTVRPANSPPAAGSFPTSLPLPDPTPGSHSPFAARPLPKEPPAGRDQPRRPPPTVPELPPVQAMAVPLPPVAPASAVAPGGPRTRHEQMWAEVEPWAADLANALRPSVRERAATALAGGRHASHPEVKRLLAQAAMTDPAGSVQAHCVRVLSALGYHAPEYVEFLQASVGGRHPALKQAAAAALARLTPR